MKLTATLFMLIGVICLHIACNKTGGFPPPPPPDPCLTLNLGMNGAVTNPSTPGGTDGSISVTAWGGTNFRYSINGGGFQAGSLFSNLTAGNYSITVRNGEGCMSTVSFTLINPVISCAGINVVVTMTATTNTLCESPGAILTVQATGGTAPYYYSLNGGPSQSSNIFYNVVTGSSSVTVTDANGCSGSASTTIGNGPAGALFTQVRTLIQTHCVYCHGSINPSAGLNLADPCKIVANKILIKARAVDGVPSPMPVAGLLSASDRQKITNWITAGGRYSD